MKVRLLNSTLQAEEILILSKRTRHLTSPDCWEEVLNMTEEQKLEELSYVFSTIGSSWEFVDYIFLITDVTRAFTHQLVRHRVGVAYAQQAQRVVDLSDSFDYLATDSCEGDEAYSMIMEMIKTGYASLIRRGKNPQDARGVLPTNIMTNILFKVNLRALSEICAKRLCYRAQGEFQNVAKALRKEVLAVHPWVSNKLDVYCIQHSVCCWPRFECPLKDEFPELNGMQQDRKDQLHKFWSKISEDGFDPQPSAHKISE